MRGPVRRAIDDGKYNLSIVWDKLDPEEKLRLLDYVIIHSHYSKDAHMGMLPLMGLNTIFEVLGRVERTQEQFYRRANGYWERKNPEDVERFKTMIRFEVKRRLKFDERLAKLRAKERRTA